MQEWFVLASEAEPHLVQVFALGWLVPYCHLQDGDNPFPRNVGIQQLADSVASICQFMDGCIHTFLIQWKSNCNAEHLKVTFFW